MPEIFYDIKLVADWDQYKAGETVAVRSLIARNLVAQGIARCPALNPVVAEEPKAAKPKPVKVQTKRKAKAKRK